MRTRHNYGRGGLKLEYAVVVCIDVGNSHRIAWVAFARIHEEVDVFQFDLAGFLLISCVSFGFALRPNDSGPDLSEPSLEDLL